MNHHVPDFEIDEDYSIPTSSTLTRPKKSPMAEDEIMELLWQNGQIVMQRQLTQRSLKKPPKFEDALLTADQSMPTREMRSSHDQQQQQHLFMQEDEMASWLHYPLNDTNFDQDFCADLLYPSTTCITSTTTTANIAGPPSVLSNVSNPEVRLQPVASAAVSAPRPPISPARRGEAVQNLACFSGHGARGDLECGSSNSKSVVRESTVVDSCETATARISEVAVTRSADNTCRTVSGAAVAGTGPASNIETTAACEITVTSSPGCSSSSAEPQVQKAPKEDRKRKGREEETEYPSEDAEFESADVKEGVRGSASTKRSRAAEVHNLSERRRRDRINEKMRALQELIPRCNKSDKASMLDEAIEYLKSLQLQVQMMSTGCSMVPMMFPGIQQYILPMGMGMGMGMGMAMGMDIGMNRLMMPFPNVMAGAPPAPPAAAAHLGPRFPVPPFQIPYMPAPDPSRVQAPNQSDPMLSSPGAQNPNQPRVPTLADPYQYYLGLHQIHVPVAQNQSTAQPSTSKPSTSQGAENLDNHQSG